MRSLIDHLGGEERDIDVGYAETPIADAVFEELAAIGAEFGLAPDVEVTTEASGAEVLPFADGSFDLVFGHAILHHLPDLQESFNEFYRLLKPGGTIAFATWPPELFTGRMFMIAARYAPPPPPGAASSSSVTACPSAKSTAA